MVLYILPSYRLGGINTSLLNFLKSSNINPDQFQIFVMDSTQKSHDLFSSYHQLKSSFLLNAWLSVFSTLNTKQKLTFFIFKVIKKFFLIFHIDLTDKIFRCVAHLKRFQSFSTVVSFAEGDATRLGAYIPSGKRVAWIHCNLNHSSLLPNKELKYYRHFTKIYCVSKYTMSVSQNLFPSIKDSFDYCYNIINPDVLKLSTNLSSDLLSKWSKIISGKNVVVSLGRLNSIKQFSKIPKLTKSIIQSIPNFLWLIIGCGEEYDLIKSEISKYGVEKNVKLLGYLQNPYFFLKNSSLCICTSKSEACPMIFLEANLLGTYILSTDFPSSSELLSPETGYIASLDSFPSVIVKLLQNLPNTKVQDKYMNDSLSKFLSVSEH